MQAKAFHDAIQSCSVILRYCCMIAAQRVHNVLSRRIVQEAANSARLVSLCIAVQENVAVRLSGKKGTVFTETRKESGACCKSDRDRWGESQERLRRRRCSGLGDARKKPIVWQDIAQHHNKIALECDTSERMEQRRAVVLQNIGKPYAAHTTGSRLLLQRGQLGCTSSTRYAQGAE